MKAEWGKTPWILFSMGDKKGKGKRIENHQPHLHPELCNEGPTRRGLLAEAKLARSLGNSWPPLTTPEQNSRPSFANVCSPQGQGELPKWVSWLKIWASLEKKARPALELREPRTAAHICSTLAWGPEGEPQSSREFGGIRSQASHLLPRRRCSEGK